MQFQFQFHQVLLYYAFIGLTLSLAQGFLVRRLAPRVGEVVMTMAGGVTTPFRPDISMLLSMLMSPGWLWSMWKHGHPRFANLQPYISEKAGVSEVVGFL